MQYKAKQGEYTGGQGPYGRRVGADGARLELHPDKQHNEAGPARFAQRGCRYGRSPMNWSGAGCGAGRDGGSRPCK